MTSRTRAAYQGTLPVKGRATLVGGTVVVASKAVTDTCNIMLTIQSLGTVTVPHPICVSARTPKTSFTILSDAGTDTSVIGYSITEP